VASPGGPGGRPAPRRLRRRWLVAAVGATVGSCIVGVVVGPTGISPWRAVASLVDHLPLVRLDAGLTDTEAAVVWSIRFPRVVLGLLVGGMLASAGAAYQGVFRNPLADPYLLGVAAGAGLGATAAIVSGVGGGGGALDPVPLAAFAGGVGAAVLTYLLGGAWGTARSPASLILAGVAMASLFTAAQTFVLQRHSDSIRPVYHWILGRLSTAGWSEVLLALPYVVVTAGVLVAYRRVLDVMTIGDEEASGLGLSVGRSRLVVVVAASLGTGAAVAVGGLIGFVGIIVPHTIRLLGGASYRVILPLSLLLGGAFLVAADVVARTALAPAELPIGVVTAFCGAPFFVVLLRLRRTVPV